MRISIPILVPPGAYTEIPVGTGTTELAPFSPTSLWTWLFSPSLPLTTLVV